MTFERAADKLRFYELEPAAPAWVHTVEISRGAPACFVSLWVCSKEYDVHPPMRELVAGRPDLAEHNPGLFHADDEVYRWVEERFQGKAKRNWRQHFHFRFDEDPGLEQVRAVLDAVGSGVGAALRDEVLKHLENETIH